LLSGPRVVCGSQNSMKSHTRTILLGAGLILLVTLTAYIPLMRAGYVCNDETYVTCNPNLRTDEGPLENLGSRRCGNY